MIKAGQSLALSPAEAYKELAVSSEFTVNPAVDKIHALERAIFDQCELLNLKVTHYFTPGLYCREIYMPKGAVLTSKVHKTEHVFIVSQGIVSVTGEEGNVILEAPYTGITMPGTKRALYIIEDTVWTTMHPTNLTDVDEIEKEIICPNYEQYLLESKE